MNSNIYRAALLTALLGASSIALAAHHKVESSQTAKLDQLQQQLESLKSDLGHSQKLVNSSANLSKTAASYSANGHVHVASDSQDPFSQLPSTSIALSLLQEKQEFAGNDLVFGSYLEFDGQRWGGSYDQTIDDTRYHSGSGINLTTADINLYANVNSWTSIFTTLHTSLGAANKVTLAESFITLGDLSKTPIYLTVGRLRLATGVFGGGGPWSATLVRSAFRTDRMDQVLLGYNYQGLSTHFEVFNNSPARSDLADFVSGLRYQKHQGPWFYTIGGNYLYDIRSTASTIGQAYTDNLLSGKRNAMIEVSGSVDYGSVGLLGEFVSTTSNASLVPQQQSRGKLASYDITAHYSPVLWGQKTTLLASFSATEKMAGIPMGLAGHAVPSLSAPEGIKRQWIIGASRKVFPHVFVGPEFQHATLYNNAGHTWAATLDFSVYV